MQSMHHRHSILIHRMIIVLHMYVLIVCFSVVSMYAAHAQSSYTRQLKLIVEKTVLAYPFSGAKTINVTLFNTSKISATVTVAENYRQSIGISMFDKTEVPVPLKKSAQKKPEEKTASSPSYRSITIEPKSGYTFIINLEDYVAIPAPGVYKIQARYYPKPQTEAHKDFIASQAILIPITDFTKNKALILPSEGTTEYYAEQTLRKYSPDAVVTKMLSALQEQDWEVYFRVIDVRSFYINTTVSDDAFGTLSTAQQNAELANFKKRIINSSKNAIDISSPDHFNVEKTYFTHNNAEVTTLLYNVHDESTTIKRFMFYLKRIHNIWKVVDYNARLVSIISTRDFEENILRTRLHEDTTVQNSDYFYPVPTKQSP